jgi:hypothetical protein
MRFHYDKKVLLALPNKRAIVCELYLMHIPLSDRWQLERAPHGDMIIQRHNSSIYASCRPTALSVT